MTPVALPSIADLDHAVADLTDALITTTDATAATPDGGWYIESTVEELRAALAEVASRGRAVGVPASLLAGASRAWQAGRCSLSVGETGGGEDSAGLGGVSHGVDGFGAAFVDGDSG